MRRNLGQLTSNVYDLLVIGGGIYGAWVAWDAVLRGLSVALVDKGDFGSATSANSLKIVHGGFRYLQHGDFRRMRESISERRNLMRVAPHLVHPLPVLIPTYGHWMQRKEMITLALAINDFISADRNWGSDPQKRIPRGRPLSRQEVAQQLPEIPETGLTGGILFHDAQIYNSERLILSVLRAAAKAGAELANYIQVTGFLKAGDWVAGVLAKDVLTGDCLAVQARRIVNAAGPWVDNVLGLLNGLERQRRNPVAKAVNLVTRSLGLNCAVGVASQAGYHDSDALINKGNRFLFAVPWRGYSLVGTTYTAFDGDPDALQATGADVQDLLAEFNRAWPSARLNRDDVRFVHSGLLPSSGIHPTSGDVQLAKHYQIREHRKEGAAGLISVAGVKYTTARQVAEKAVNLVFEGQGQKPPKSSTATTPIFGGYIERFEKFLESEEKKMPLPLDREVAHRVLFNYGSAYKRVLACLEPGAGNGSKQSNNLAIWKAEVRYGVREEMAQKLSDVVFRRTELGAAGPPEQELLMACAETMGAELEWPDYRVRQELQEVDERYLLARVGA